MHAEQYAEPACSVRKLRIARRVPLGRSVSAWDAPPSRLHVRFISRQAAQGRVTTVNTIVDATLVRTVSIRSIGIPLLREMQSWQSEAPDPTVNSL